MFLHEKPGWLMALICFIILAVSLGFERLLHITGMHLKRRNRKPLYDALQKFKEELMILGFISLLLELVPEKTTRMCVTAKLVHDLLPCDNSPQKHKCQKAIIHMVLSVLTVLSGETRMRKWGRWEDSQVKAASEGPRQRFVLLHENEFIKRRYTGIRTYSTFVGWLQCFLRQFYRPVAISDYETLRRGFITAHCKENQKFNFHKYLLRMLEYDFETVLGISWYLWIFVVIFLLLNVYGLESYVYIAYIPVIVLLAIGTKLEHIMTQLAHEVAEKSTIIEGELVVRPSDAHFWFHRPQFILFLIHFILFQNAFEITYLIWFLFQKINGACDSAKPSKYTVLVRLITGMIVRIFCSYSTMPLYALVTQMGTQIMKPIFEENVRYETGGDDRLTIETSTDELQMVDLRASNINRGNMHNVDEANTSEIVEND